MKLNEMTTDQLSDALCELADPVERICRDATVMGKLKKLAGNAQDGMMMIEKLGATVGIWIPALLKDHRADLYKIMSVLTGESVSEIAKGNGMETIKKARAALNGEVLDFFKLFAGMA